MTSEQRLALARQALTILDLAGERVGPTTCEADIDPLVTESLNLATEVMQVLQPLTESEFEALPIGAVEKWLSCFPLGPSA